MTQDIEMSQGETSYSSNSGANERGIPPSQIFERALKSAVEEAVGEAVDKAAHIAVAKAVDQAIDKAVDKAVERAFERFFEGFRASKSSKPNVGKVTEQARDQTADHSSNGNNTGDHGTHIWNRPCPQKTYEIRFGHGQKLKLGVYKEEDYPVLLVERGATSVEDDEDEEDVDRTHHSLWHFIEADGWLCFKNSATQKYLGVAKEYCPKFGYVITATHDKIGENTKFCLRRDGHGGYMLQTHIRGRLFKVEPIADYSIINGIKLCSETIRLVCNDAESEEPSSLTFKSAL